MGANTFFTTASGKTAYHAFRAACDDARHESGHGGYTGTIAEKTEFCMITCPPGKEPAAYARELMDNDDPRIDDTWGPAGCIGLGGGKFLFFGWASS